jgi:hypothetical protein
MNSFALGLRLGGLRGPLVMFLWVQSETQKSDKNLEGVDTQIEWIRLLQPEFDTVHIFQIWNKAYNISVQMASRANKYSVILGALDYARSVDAAKPEDINIVSAIGQLYFDKLGYSAEKFYYRMRVRNETVAHDAAPARTVPGQHNRLQPVCDSKGFLLPDLIAPRYDHPPRLPSDTEYDNGADLQYLPPFQPFSDGVSTFALAYNYYKRSEVLQNKFQQQHDQMSDQVIDSRPALACKFWIDEDVDQGRRREFYAFGLNFPENEDDQRNLDEIQYVTARVTVTYPWLDLPSQFQTRAVTDEQKAKERADRQDAFRLAIHDYDEAARVCEIGNAEYIRHIINFPQQESLYESHRLQMNAQAAMAAGDRDFLKAMLATGAERDALMKSSQAHYEFSIDQAGRSLFKYYVDAETLKAALPAGYTQRPVPNVSKGIDDMTQAQVLEAVQKEDEFRVAHPKHYQNSDRYEYDRYIVRARSRIQAMQATGTTMPTTSPAK